MVLTDFFCEITENYRKNPYSDIVLSVIVILPKYSVILQNMTVFLMLLSVTSVDYRINQYFYRSSGSNTEIYLFLLLVSVLNVDHRLSQYVYRSPGKVVRALT